jgi:DNA-binding GntR family transcriptional regulator
MFTESLASVLADLPKQGAKSEKIAWAIREACLKGKFKQGHRLPNCSAIARRYSVSVNTVAKSMALLEQWGVVRHEQGVGFFYRGKKLGR